VLPESGEKNEVNTSSLRKIYLKRSLCNRKERKARKERTDEFGNVQY